MEPLDPKAELMRLADEFAQWFSVDEHYSTEHRRHNRTESRAALSVAIDAALADARRQSEDRLQIALGALADIAASSDMTLTMARRKAKRIYEQLVDGKAGGT